MVKYGTLEYYNVLGEALNKDEVFTKSGISTTIINRFTDKKNVSGGMLSILMKMEKGKVVDVTEVGEKDDAEFIGTADYATMAIITKGELDSQRAMKDGTLKYKYSTLKAVRYNKTLQRISTVAQALQVEY